MQFGSDPNKRLQKLWFHDMHCFAGLRLDWIAKYALYWVPFYIHISCYCNVVMFCNFEICFHYKKNLCLTFLQVHAFHKSLARHKNHKLECGGHFPVKALTLTLLLVLSLHTKNLHKNNINNTTLNTPLHLCNPEHMKTLSLNQIFFMFHLIKRDVMELSPALIIWSHSTETGE